MLDAGIRLRPVRGRVIDPYRGTPEDVADRFAPRAADAQPFDEIAAAIRKHPGVTVHAAGRRFKLVRGNDVLRIAFASAGRRVSLDDAVLEGDAVLAIELAHALLPLLGAVEVRAGAFVDLVDGHEPVETVVQRYRTYWVEEALRLASELGAAAKPAMPAPPAPAPAPAPASSRRRMVEKIVWAVGVTLVVILVVYWLAAGRKTSVGGACQKNSDCRSETCLPHEAVRVLVIDGVDLSTVTPAPHLTDPSGVCTESCDDDADCPSSLRCGEVLRYSSIGIGATKERSCVPRDW